MFANWTVRKRKFIILIISIIILFIIGLIATPIRRSPDIDSSLGSAVFYSLTITLPILIVKYSYNRKVKIMPYIIMLWAVIILVLFGIFQSSTYRDAKRDLVYSYITENSLNDCEVQSSPGSYVVGNVDECRNSLYKKKVNSVEFISGEINLRIYAIYHAPEEFLTFVAIILAGKVG